MDTLEACKLAYRKHHLGDESIGWEELSNCLFLALCNEMGDEGYQDWLKNAVEEPWTCRRCGDPNITERCQGCNADRRGLGGEC